MIRTVSTDYRAVNRLGVTVRTFGDEDRARAWVRANAAFHDGLELQVVTVTEASRRVYRPRPKADLFAIPRPAEQRLYA